MKKNLIAVIILALVLVNIGLTAVMLFSITSTNKTTADLVTRIAGAMDMELSSANGAEYQQPVPIENVATYDIADPMTLRLKPDENGGEHYIMLSITFSMNTAHEDYATYGADVATRESLIKSEINTVVGKYTTEEAQADEAGLKQAILEAVQNLYGSDFIYKVDFRDVKYSG